MNIENINRILDQYYAKIDVISKNKDIVRCEKHHKGIPYQIIYFDSSKKWLEDEFDLEKYLEKLLTNDYYSNSGYLQWNYYIVFLYDHKVPSDEKKLNIEINEEFARKFVVNYEMLDDWLDQKYKVETDTSLEISQDLSLIWMNKLKSNDLDCVYSPNLNYAEDLISFIEGTPWKEPDEIEDSNQSNINDEKITAIKKIVLEKYRKYPIKPDFEFGKVNLIFGKNGSGKTSLLEAIELFLCGKNFRDPKKQNNSISVKILYDGEQNFEYIDIKNTKKYKSRNGKWYNNPNQRGNNLYVNFHRFNFFNSDAAVSFSNEGSTDLIKKAFIDIALGGNINFIEKKLNGYSDRFQKEKRDFEKYIFEYEQYIKREKNTLEEIINEGDKDPKYLFDIFIYEAKKIKWKGILPQSSNDSYATFEKDYSNITLYLSNILEINWFENLTVDSLYAEKSKLDKLKINLIKINEKINVETKKTIEAKKRIDYIHEILTIFNKINEYQQAKVQLELIGLDEKITKFELKELKYNETIQIIDNIDFTPLDNSNYTLDEYTIYLEKEVSYNLLKKSELIGKISKLEEGFTQLEDIIIEIKSKGREFLDLSPDAQNCPLCNANYNKDELKSLIEFSHESMKDSNILNDLLYERDKLFNKIEYLNFQLENIANVEKAISKIESIDLYSKYHLCIINEKLGNVGDEILKIQKELRDLSILKNDLNSRGFSESEYTALKEDLVKKGIEIDDIDPDDFADIIKKYEIEYEKVKHICNKAQEEIIIQTKLSEKLIYNSKNIYSDDFSTYSDDFKTVLHSRIEKISSSIKLLDNLAYVIAIPPNIPINKIKINADSLYKLFGKFKYEKNLTDKTDIIIKKSEMTIQLYQNKIKEIMEKKERIDKACFTINDILINDSKEKYMQDFLNGNNKEIVRIFNSIHSPKEFENILFDKSNIELKKLNSTKLVKLSEISTGQRSALALSVFICLNNKLQNGPPYLIFDDPISFVDDINTLSFIDYLREIAIKDDKQIFFATANENLKFLFSQKFKFLECEFKTYTLARP